jgi:hypothetical protein
MAEKSVSSKGSPENFLAHPWARTNTQAYPWWIEAVTLKHFAEAFTWKQLVTMMSHMRRN